MSSAGLALRLPVAEGRLTASPARGPNLQWNRYSQATKGGIRVAVLQGGLCGLQAAGNGQQHRCRKGAVLCAFKYAISRFRAGVCGGRRRVRRRAGRRQAAEAALPVGQPLILAACSYWLQRSKPDPEGGRGAWPGVMSPPPAAPDAPPGYASAPYLARFSPAIRTTLARSPSMAAGRKAPSLRWDDLQFTINTREGFLGAKRGEKMLLKGVSGECDCGVEPADAAGAAARVPSAPWGTCAWRQETFSF